MKLSTKSRYGLKAMIDLGVNGKMSVNTIAERHNISESYLEQIIALLKENKLVKSSKGAHGGYSLAKDTKDISLGDILRALEGDLNAVTCVEDGECSNAYNCSFRYIWMKVTEGINSVVDNMTLDELINDHKRIKGE